jgi:hypothetical protein
MNLDLCRKIEFVHKTIGLGTLTMGCFSWIAQDTNKPIYMTGYQKPGYEQRTYYMWDDKGNFWKEPSYEGYGVFGGKDYYILLAEMNYDFDDDITDDEKRKCGINIEFNSNHDNIVFPNLTETSIWKWKNKKPDQHYNQGCYEGYFDDE